jgi:protein arginine kinase
MVFIRRSGAASEGCDIALCETCANGRGISAGKGALELNIDDLIGSSLAESSPSGPSTCPNCGLELASLRREGRLGCSECASHFSAEIERALGRRASSFSEAESFPTGAPRSKLLRELDEALLSEDYEAAARLRDELALIAGAGHAGSASAGYAFDPFAFVQARGPDDDVVLHTTARVQRNILGLPFPGSPKGGPSPSRAAILDRAKSRGSWKLSLMSELGPAARRALSERGIAPRGYAADDSAAILTDSLGAAFALIDDGDHLRVLASAPGLSAGAALSSALAFVEDMGGDFAFAKRPGLGWISSRISDCGLGMTLSATVHLPALAAAGMRDRLFRALMSEGLFVRGLYSSSEDSAGALYEVGCDTAAAASSREMAELFSSALAKAVSAERRARAEISERGRGALVDAEGRAFGITRYFSLAGAEESASLLSVLRLAALRGSLSGADQRFLGAMLTALGTGSIALSAGLRELPEAGAIDALRARAIKEALSRAEYIFEEGA